MKSFHECRHFLRLNRDQEMSAGKTPERTVLMHACALAICVFAWKCSL